MFCFLTWTKKILPYFLFHKLTFQLSRACLFFPNAAPSAASPAAAAFLLNTFISLYFCSLSLSLSRSIPFLSHLKRFAVILSLSLSFPLSPSLPLSLSLSLSRRLEPTALQSVIERCCAISDICDFERKIESFFPKENSFQKSVFNSFGVKFGFWHQQRILLGIQHHRLISKSTFFTL